jgi:hypothetical protein
MNKRTFDLVLMETVGILVLWGGLSMWSRSRLMHGSNSGPGYSVAKVAKAVTA